MLEFELEFLKAFTGQGGKNLLFYSEKTSDNAGYVINFSSLRLLDLMVAAIVKRKL